MKWLKASWYVVITATVLWASGIIPAIIPQAVPAANKQGSTGTKFLIATGAFTTGNSVQSDASGNAVDSGYAVVQTGSGLVNQWVNGVTVGGVLSFAQVFFTNLGGSATVSQIPAMAKAMWFPSAGCAGTTPASAYDLPAANAPTPACNGTSYRFGTLDYADSANQSASFHYQLPTGWTGTVDATVRWSVNATTQAAKWTLATICVAAGEDLLNPTFNAVQTINSTSSGTANTLTSVTQSAMTMTGCAAGENLIVLVGRDVTDTSTAVILLVGVELILRITPQS